MQRSRPHNILSLFTTSVAIASIPTLFVPFESALANWSELSIGFDQLGATLALPFGLLSLAVFTCGALLTLALGQRGLAMLVAALLCTWLQSRFLVWDYGVFDGTPIDWSEHRGAGVLEGLLWLAVFVVAIVRSETFAARATAIALFSLAVQLGAAGIDYRNRGPFEPRRSSQAATEQESAMRGITEFSSTENVIVLVLDTLQSDFLAELLGDTEFAKRVPAGFVYYRNAVSAYPHTQHSLPAMLTSKRPLRQPPPRWTAELMKASLPAKLQETGWKSSILTTTPPYLACNRVRFAFQCESPRFFLAASQSDATRDFDAVGDARALLRIGAFRALPHFAKAWIYDGGRWRLLDPLPTEALPDTFDERIWYESRRDLAVWKTLIEAAKPVGTAARFKFLHFFGAHHPSSINADCEWNGLENPEPAERNEAMTRDRSFAVGAAQCALERSFVLLEKLDELGIYDSSLVFIVGDHGRQHSPIELTHARPPLARATAGQPAKPALAHASKGVPLVMVKRRDDRQALRISDAPVSLCDLPKSIASELGISHDYECESIFELSEDQTRRRLHFRGMDDYEKPFSTYRVDGHSWLPESWARVRR